MTNRLGVLFLLAGAAAASPAFAGDSATMKCNATQDRIWVYDSLNSFDVSAKLKCGETVEITGRVKGYVKILAANGTQGYVPDTTFPDLPPYVDPNDAQASAPIAKRVAPRNAATAPASAPSMASNISAPAPAAVPAPAPVAVTVAPSAAPAPTPAPAPAVRTVAETASAPVAVTSISVVAAPSTPALSASAKSTPAPSPSRKPTPAVAPASKPQPQPPAPAAPAATSHAPALTSTSATSSTRSSSPAPSKMANTKSAAAPPQPSGAHPAPTPSVPTPAVPTPAKPVETAVTVQPQPAREVASVHTVAATESDEYPDYQPENASADPACRLFFSAYGISPAQAKWIAQNRKKQFSSICPAPNVSSVDYVIIFTHDVDFFGSTLPTPVHTDHNGFSDFSPLTMIDTALVPMSEADKSHREYVWVFKMQRGNFEPGKFSPRKRPQFTKTESHAPTRTVEEAFRFIESGGPSQ
jgi:hypothetical protein